MIDIHNHILPGIDDGAKTEKDSIEMAKAAMDQGIHTIIVTPHHKNGHYNNDKSTILRQISFLKQLFASEDIPLTLLPGQETRINGDMIEDLRNGELMSLNGTKYIHVEFPTREIPRYADRMLYELQLEGYVPIIVHPERNQEIMEDPNKLFSFVQQGALTQVTAASLIGKFGKTSQKVTQQLIEANLTHFIASDAHNTTTRGYCMAEAHKQLGSSFGNELVYLFLENGQFLIENKNVNKLEPQIIKKKKLFGLF